MTTIVIGGTEIKAHDTGRVAYDGSRAHIYKLSPGSQFPGEVIVIGPFTYTNANVQASLQSPEVPPWTKLDTRKLSAKAAANQTDELSHVLAPAYLAFGASHVTLAPSALPTARSSGRASILSSSSARRLRHAAQRSRRRCEATTRPRTSTRGSGWTHTTGSAA